MSEERKCVVPGCPHLAVEGTDGLCEVHFGQYEDTQGDYSDAD